MWFSFSYFFKRKQFFNIYKISHICKKSKFFSVSSNFIFWKNPQNSNLLSKSPRSVLFGDSVQISAKKFL